MIDLFNQHINFNIVIGRCRWHLNRRPPFDDAPWLWSDPTIVAEAISIIEEEALPFLRSIDTLEKYVAYHREHTAPHWPQWPEARMVTEIAMGELGAARRSWGEIEDEYKENKHPDLDDYQTRRDRVLAVVEPLLAGDRAALARILHGWEAGNVLGTKIERHWEPTPFPLERQGA